LRDAAAARKTNPLHRGTHRRLPMRPPQEVLRVVPQEALLRE
jgi:hypothetical protein